MRPHNSAVTEPKTLLALFGLNFYQKPSHTNKQPEVCSDHHGECKQGYMTSRNDDSDNRAFVRSRYPETANKRERAT